MSLNNDDVAAYDRLLDDVFTDVPYREESLVYNAEYFLRQLNPEFAAQVYTHGTLNYVAKCALDSTVGGDQQRNTALKGYAEVARVFQEGLTAPFAYGRRQLRLPLPKSLVKSEQPFHIFIEQKYAKGELAVFGKEFVFTERDVLTHAAIRSNSARRSRDIYQTPTSFNYNRYTSQLEGLQFDPFDFTGCLHPEEPCEHWTPRGYSHSVVGGGDQPSQQAFQELLEYVSDVRIFETFSQSGVE